MLLEKVVLRWRKALARPDRVYGLGSRFLGGQRGRKKNFGSQGEKEKARTA